MEPNDEVPSERLGKNLQVGKLSGKIGVRTAMVPGWTLRACRRQLVERILREWKRANICTATVL